MAVGAGCFPQVDGASTIMRLSPHLPLTPGCGECTGAQGAVGGVSCDERLERIRCSRFMGLVSERTSHGMQTSTRIEPYAAIQMAPARRGALLRNRTLKKGASMDTVGEGGRPEARGTPCRQKNDARERGSREAAPAVIKVSQNTGGNLHVIPPGRFRALFLQPQQNTYLRGHLNTQIPAEKQGKS